MNYWSLSSVFTLLILFSLNWECDAKVYKEFHFFGNETKDNIFYVGKNVSLLKNEIKGPESISLDYSTVLVEMETLDDIADFMENEALNLMHQLGNVTRIIVSLDEGFIPAVQMRKESVAFRKYANETASNQMKILVSLLDRIYKALGELRNSTENRITIGAIKLHSSIWRLYGHDNYGDLRPVGFQRNLRKDNWHEYEDLIKSVDFCVKYFNAYYPLFLEVVIVEDNVSFWGQIFYLYENFENYLNREYNHVMDIMKKLGTTIDSEFVLKLYLNEKSLSSTNLSEESFIRYGQLLATFAFKWGQQTKRRVSFTIRKDSDIQEKSANVKDFTQSHIKFARITNSWFEKRELSDKNLEKMMNLLRNEFTEIMISIVFPDKLIVGDQTANSTEFINFFEHEVQMSIEFWNKYFNKKGISPFPISILVESALKKTSHQTISDMLISSTAKIATNYSGQISYLIFKFPLQDCTHPFDFKIELNLDKLTKTNVKFGVAEMKECFSYEYTPDVFGKVDLVLIGSFAYSALEQKDFKRVAELLNDLRLRLQKANSGLMKKPRIVIEGLWDLLYGSNDKWNCYGFKTYWNLLSNWAQVHGFEVTNAVSNICDIDKSGDCLVIEWFKDFYEKGLEDVDLDETFMSYARDTCVVVDTEGAVENFQFDQDLSGVTLDLGKEEFRNLSTHLLTRWLQLIQLKFLRVEVLLSGDNQLQLFLDAINRLKDRTEPELFEKYRYFLKVLNIANLPILQVLEREKAVAGIHFEPPSKNKEIGIHKSNLKLGFTFKFKGQPILPDHLKKLISFANYIILDVDLPELFVMSRNRGISTKNVTEDDLVKMISRMKELNTGLVLDNLRALRYYMQWLNKNITTMVRVKWPTLTTNIASDTTENFLRIWSFVNDFSRSFNFPFFVHEAFDGKLGNNGRSYGWWKLEDYSDMSENSMSKVTEKQADYFGKETPKPSPEPMIIQEKETDYLVEYIVVGVIVGTLITFFAVLVFIYRLRKQGRILSKEEVERFRDGYKSSEEDDYGTDLLIFGEKYDSYRYEIKKEDFNLDESTWVGTGNFGVVYKTRMPKFEGVVAVKIPKKLSPLELHSCTNTFLDEIKIMSYVGRHQNILELMGAYTREIENGVVYIVTEYCEGGTLLHELRTLRESTTKDDYELYRFCQDISSGMDYLSQKHVIHGDLSTRNVLLSRDRSCKISDFGLAHKLGQYEIYVKRSEDDPLPWRWMALESLETGKFTLKSDIWSMGITFWEIFSFGEQPYVGMRYNHDFTEYLRNGSRLTKPVGTSEEIYNQMLACWDSEPSSRPIASDFIGFFRNLRGNEYSLI